MAIRPILKYGAAILHQPAADVPAITPDVTALIEDLIATMHSASGVGLAAPQLGHSQRVFVIDTSVGRVADDLHVLINPTFLKRDGMQLEEEGCLSVPGFHATVARPLHVVVRALQHEMDHLNGILFVDRLKGVQRRLILRRIEGMRRRGKW